MIECERLARGLRTFERVRERAILVAGAVPVEGERHRVGVLRRFEGEREAEAAAAPRFGVEVTDDGRPHTIVTALDGV